MSQNYYEQEYHEKESNIPDVSFKIIARNFFFKPFTWKARSTRKEFWIGYAIQFVLSTILTTLMISSLLLYGTVDMNNTGWSAPVIRVTVTVGIIETILGLLLLWVKLGLLGSAIRRLHDSNREGGWFLLYFVPFGWIFILYLMIMPTVEEPVKWGSYLLS